MQEINRSTDSSCRDRELLDVLLQKTDEPRSDNGSRITALLNRTNGNLSRPSSFSRRSLNLSHPSLASDSHVSVAEPADNSAVKFLYSLAVLCLASLILSALSFQVLISLESLEDGLKNTSGDGMLNSSAMYSIVYEATTSLATLVIGLDLSCLMVCSMQCFFTAKILRTYEGSERAFKYLKECSSSRFIAVFSFFLSIPVYMVALALYILMKFRSTAALSCIIILCICVLFCVLSVMQNIYHWRVEKSRSDEGLPVYDGHVSSGRTVSMAVNRHELSTLV
ncbi:hypothetical protein LOTGIDRAFT_165785 [Lottia gigantea]|uniref:Transmembrane protein n=1 Tax=Lottia gigantea TaxID=225164 RepID=V4BIB6_LOTGI|nr:hypothetical protein LOTGIDRAFT_165785 [Lottia gigantea]ESO88344.1 hypothetical protein LOTGIDRAFT_165785 [Lottia gigantea]